VEAFRLAAGRHQWRILSSSSLPSPGPTLKLPPQRGARLADIAKDDRITLDGELVTVVAVTATPDGFECIVKSPTRGLVEAFLRRSQLVEVKVAAHDGGGDAGRALTAVWARWMAWSVPRLRSAVLATRPLRPYAHQDDAVFGVMLSQPRLRFLLADEPGTGKTLMTGMYLAEGRRRELIPGKTIIVVPAHLVKKWIRELHRFFGIDAHPITPEIGRDPLDLRADVDVWIVSMDLYTHNPDVRRKVVGTRASWSLAVFDEAHRLTPTSQYLGAAAQLAELSHHLLLLTATPHRGKEHFFRALLHLLDPGLYPWDSSVNEYGDMPQRPGRDNFLRRMKEDLRDLDGNPLFPPRFAETRDVRLTPAEADAYTAVMDYVDTWYDATSVLARSIYGKRAASCIPSALATLQRRAGLLAASQAGKVDPVAPHGFDRPNFNGADLDSDEAWEAAEQSVLQARSRDRRAELEAVRGVIGRLELALTSKDEPAKWQAATKLLAERGIAPGHGGAQLLVFTEFLDTARWLAGLFRQAGFLTEVLEGGLDQRDRDSLQERFLAGDYQVLVSTDAGGEGIDLQSANVMIDWDIPWSLVRLEQRAGRLHRIGQTRPVYVYHLVGPKTREGRVQQVMLDNLTAAAQALHGRIYDLLDATADRAGFDFAAAMAAAQRNPAAAEAIATGVPDAEVLIARAKDIVAEEDRLRSPVNTSEAMERLAADRLQAVNPVIVDAFVEQVAGTAGWTLSSGPATGIKLLRAPEGLPAHVALGSECLVAADGASVAKARSEGFRRSADVVVLGPTEEPFQALVEYAARTCEADLVRGAAAIDLASLTSYTLFVYAADPKILR
jgi:superfamily II DNA or RNA helicase